MNGLRDRPDQIFYASISLVIRERDKKQARTMTTIPSASHSVVGSLPSSIMVPAARVFQRKELRRRHQRPLQRLSLVWFIQVTGFIIICTYWPNAYRAESVTRWMYSYTDHLRAVHPHLHHQDIAAVPLPGRRGRVRQPRVHPASAAGRQLPHAGASVRVDAARVLH